MRCLTPSCRLSRCLRSSHNTRPAEVISYGTPSLLLTHICTQLVISAFFKNKSLFIAKMRHFDAIHLMPSFLHVHSKVVSSPPLPLLYQIISIYKYSRKHLPFFCDPSVCSGANYRIYWNNSEKASRKCYSLQFHIHLPCKWWMLTIHTLKMKLFIWSELPYLYQLTTYRLTFNIGVSNPRTWVVYA